MVVQTEPGALPAFKRNLDEQEGTPIDISPTACRVMAKRLHDVCGLHESEKAWQAGRGFIVRDLPWTEEQLRKIPPFEFENWAVIALGGIPNKTKVGDKGIDGRIYPTTAHRRNQSLFPQDRQGHRTTHCPGDSRRTPGDAAGIKSIRVKQIHSF